MEKVRCIQDFGYAKKGGVYYVRKCAVVDICGRHNLGIYDILFGNPQNGPYGGRYILGDDLKQYFERIE